MRSLRVVCRPLFAHLHPRRLTLRQAQDRVRFADRSLARFVVDLVHCVRLSRDVPPTGQFLFFASPKKRNQKKGDPTEAVRPGPDCSAVLGVRGPRRTRYVRCAHAAQTNVAKSEDKACCARGPKPLRSSTPPTGPKSNTVVASQLPLSTPMRSEVCGEEIAACVRLVQSMALTGRTLVAAA